MADDKEESPFGPPPGFPKIDYPVNPRENLDLVFAHKTPYWVPVFMVETNFVWDPADNERPYPLNSSGKDWFGTTWEYVPDAGAQMVPPKTHICPDPRSWREKLIFPDLDKIDFGKDKAKMAPMFDNSSKYNMYVMQNGMFERLLDMSDSMEVFIWLKEEPEDAIEYANAMADYKIKVLDRIIDEWVPIDFFALSDDWGTQHAPFMSPDMYARIFYEPTKRIADHIHARGLGVNQHSCGKLEGIVPYIANFADVWEGQNMNDKVMIKKKYGDRLAMTISPDPAVLQNPDSTEAEVVKAVRDSIDTYGEGGGMFMFGFGATPVITETVIRETFAYSRKKYGKV
ncbi:hypothetical protein FACS1894151_00010 [Spirochaetia bacterium]|nr:hypothetical protein FACS1894151_00010 [Spirochaetia bacterium]